MLCGALRALHCASKAAIAQRCCYSALWTCRTAFSAPDPLCAYSSAWSSCNYSSPPWGSSCTSGLIQQPQAGSTPNNSISSCTSACLGYVPCGTRGSTSNISCAARSYKTRSIPAAYSTAAGGDKAKRGRKKRSQEQKVGCHLGQAALAARPTLVRPAVRDFGLPQLQTANTSQNATLVCSPGVYSCVCACLHGLLCFSYTATESTKHTNACYDDD